ncbi:MAG: ceramidase domain-containing protein [Sphingobacteriales bacterium]|nr:ceramidase domain-containing protein [Sphingobacteriales bacterium]
MERASIDTGLSRRARAGILLGLTLIVISLLYMLDPVEQAAAYHNFADKRTWWGIPNTLNVLSNLAFLFTGSYGLIMVARTANQGSISIIYATLFSGVIATGLGSAWYHYSPDSDTLLWDRLPMTIIFMSLLAATITDFIGSRKPVLLLALLVSLGIGSVFWWHFTGQQGRGDLRPYILVQYYPIVLIPLIIWLYPRTGYKAGIRQLLLVVLWYIIAKVLDAGDHAVYGALHVVSGHTLKHLAAAMSTWYFVSLFRERGLV